MKYSLIVLLCTIFLTGCDKTGFYEQDNKDPLPYFLTFIENGVISTPNTEIKAYALDEDTGQYVNFPIFVGDIDAAEIYYGPMISSSEPNAEGMFEFTGWLQIPRDFVYENDPLKSQCHATYHLVTEDLSYVVYADGVIDRYITFLSCLDVPTGMNFRALYYV